MESATAVHSDPPVFYQTEDEGHAQSGGGTLLGFWIYLMSDALIFATLFATFGVLSSSFAGGPNPHEIFDLRVVAVNTAVLLVSALTCGLSMRRSKISCGVGPPAKLELSTPNVANSVAKISASLIR